MKVTKSGLVPGAAIADADKEVLLDWLVANFGPEATPFPRQYVVRPVTDETRLDAWRERLTGKIATGVPLLIDEVDPLIDWLERRK